MGSFNVTCSISRLSISAGDRVVFIPATKDHIIKEKGDNDSWSLEPTHMFFGSEGSGLAPVSLPIYGSYDDYGGIEADEDEKHDEILKKAYGTTAQGLADFVTGRDDEYDGQLNLSFPDGLFGVFILEEVYNRAVHYMRKHKSASKDAYVGAKMLVKLGFQESEESVPEEIENRYRREFTFPDVEDFVVFSDGTWSHIMKVTEEGYVRVDNSTYHPRQFVERWYTLTNKYIPTYELDHKLETEIATEDYCDKLKLQNEAYLGFLKEGMSVKRAQLFIRTFALDSYDHRRIWCCYRHQFISDTYKETLINKDTDIMLEVARYGAVRGYMFMVQAHFFPCLTGPQCGEYEATLDLGMTVAELSRKQIRRRDEY